MSARPNPKSDVPGAPVEHLHHRLVNTLIKRQCLRSPVLVNAFRAVSRHHFLPKMDPEKVYADRAVPIKYKNGQAISSSSQPAMMAIMLEQLNLQPGHRILEIGAGTGYNAAIMAHVVGQHGQVTTIDIDADIVRRARTHLDAAGYQHVEVFQADGMHGFRSNAPYDRIILTVGGWDIPPAWLQQSKSDGRLLLPLSVNGPQVSVAFDRAGDGLISRSVHACGFMRLRGEMPEPRTRWAIGSDQQLTVELKSARHPFDRQQIFRWLTGPSIDYSTRIEIRQSELWGSLDLWHSLHGKDQCTLAATGKAAEKALVPQLFGAGGENHWRATFGKISAEGMCLFMRPLAEQAESTGREGKSFTLHVRNFGVSPTLAGRLIEVVRSWDSAGRPHAEALRIRAVRAGSNPRKAPGEHLIVRRWHTYALSWPA